MRDYLIPTLILGAMGLGVGIMTMLSMYLSYREWKDVMMDQRKGIMKKHRTRKAPKRNRGVKR